MPEPQNYEVQSAFGCRKTLQDDLRLDGIKQDLPKEKQYKRGENASLLLARYLYKLGSDDDANDARRALFDSVKDSVRKKAVYDLYNKAFKKRKDALESGGGKFVEGSVANRMIVGLGSASALETGITLNPLYGVPMIPASTVKGAVAAAFRDKYGRNGAYPYLFGSDDTTVDENGEKLETSGALCFYDAWIVPASLSSCFIDDVTTPHHLEYYGNAGQTEASAFDSPVPVTFLSVKGKFEFGIECLCEERGQREQWLNFIFQLMRDTLGESGLGSKKSSGYGKITVNYVEKTPKLYQKGDSVIVRCTDTIKVKNKKGSSDETAYKGRFVLEDYPDEIDCQMKTTKIVAKEDKGKTFNATVENDVNFPQKNTSKPICILSVGDRID